MVHVDDLAQGYLLAAQRGIGGESFNLVELNTVHSDQKYGESLLFSIRQISVRMNTKTGESSSFPGCSIFTAG